MSIKSLKVLNQQGGRIVVNCRDCATPRHVKTFPLFVENDTLTMLYNAGA
jgi:hypothetical protein